MYRVLALLAILSLNCGQRAFCQEQPLTLDDVISSFANRQTLMFEAGRFSISYSSVKCDPAAKLAPNLLSPFEAKIVRDESNWYVSRRFTEPEQGDDLLIPADPSVIIASETSTCEYRKDSKLAIQPFDTQTNLYYRLHYFSAIFLDVYKYDYESRGLDVAVVRNAYPSVAGLPFLPDFLEANRTHYSVKPGSSPNLWVVEWPGVDRIEVDRTRDNCMVSRTYTWGDGLPLRAKCTYDDYREVKPGLWLPFRVTEVAYGDIEADKSGYNKPDLAKCYRVDDINFDPVDPDIFQINIPSDTRVIDGIREFQYSTASEHVGSPFVELPALRDVQPFNENRRLFPLLVAAVLGAIALALIIVRYRRNRSLGNLDG